jgi:AcrR family transcriptional regulator
LAEIREHGLAQVAEGGQAALSLAGIAKEMGMSGPALYRYFASRDDLLLALIMESYEDFADTLTAIADRTRSDTPEERLRAVLNGTRQWALSQPHRYRLVFGSSYGPRPQARRAMDILLAALSELEPVEQAATVSDSVLRNELAKWGDKSGRPPDDPRVLLMALLTWTRVHGFISVEIEGFFQHIGVDPARLYEAETDHLIAQLTGRFTPP